MEFEIFYLSNDSEWIQSDPVEKMGDKKDAYIAEQEQIKLLTEQIDGSEKRVKKLKQQIQDQVQDQASTQAKYDTRKAAIDKEAVELNAMKQDIKDKTAQLEH